MIMDSFAYIKGRQESRNSEKVNRVSTRLVNLACRRDGAFVYIYIYIYKCMQYAYNTNTHS